MITGKEAAGQAVEAAALRIIRMGAKIVAASSVYSQQNASLAILKRVKELDPSVKTILGGHNVSGEMGMTILRDFPSVDYVSFGEGDETFAQFCSALLRAGTQNKPEEEASRIHAAGADKKTVPSLPYGIVSRDEPLPMLAEDPGQYSILAEIRANLKSEQVLSLAKAGVNITQPGIESLNDHLLKLMGKGCSAVQNIALMKYCRSYGIYPVWNMMTQVPGENREDYEQMLEIIPTLAHLNPPTRDNSIVFMRFSEYGSLQEDP